MPRYRSRKRILLLSNVAMTRARNTPTGTVSSMKYIVFQVACMTSLSLNRSVKFLKPMYFAGVSP